MGRSRHALISGACAIAGVAFFGNAAREKADASGGNLSAFLHITHDVAARAPFLDARPDLRDSLVLLDSGYDAQFMYLMAFDPLLREFSSEPQRYRDVVDYPPYRYGRIAYSAMTWAVAGGRPERFPAVMIGLILLGHFGLGVGFVMLAHRSHAPPWVALAYLSIPGYMASLTFALPESIAACAMVAATVAWVSRRPLTAAICFSLAILTRETSIILAVGVLMTAGSFTKFERLRWAVLAVLPLALWRGYVGWVLYPDFGIEAVLPSPGAFTIPFKGFMDLFGQVAANTHERSEAAAALVYPVLVMAALAFAVTIFLRSRSALDGAAVLYAVIAVSLNYERVWIHVPSGERSTSELFLALILAAVTQWRTRPQAVPLVITLLALLSAYTLFVSPEAALSRSALFVMR